jgi:hypothetical protein
VAAVSGRVASSLLSHRHRPGLAWNATSMGTAELKCETFRCSLRLLLTLSRAAARPTSLRRQVGGCAGYAAVARPPPLLDAGIFGWPLGKLDRIELSSTLAGCGT